MGLHLLATKKHQLICMLIWTYIISLSCVISWYARDASNDKNTDNGSTSYTPPVDRHGETSHRRRELWIYVSSWDEGFANWFVSLSEVVVMTRRLAQLTGTTIGVNSVSVIMVEPCIDQGKLTSCGKREGLVRLGDIFDLSWLQQSYPIQMATYETFLQATNSVTGSARTTICMHPSKNDPQCTPGVAHRFHSPLIPEIQEITRHASAPGRHSYPVSVFEIQRYRKGAFAKFAWDEEAPLINVSEANELRLKSLRFRQEHFQYVDNTLIPKLLGKSNIDSLPPSYVVIHWRAEKDRIDYHKCAQAIVHVRQNMMATNNMTLENSSFVIMSSLNLHPENEWITLQQRDRNASQEALHYLLDSEHFLKLDTILPTLAVGPPDQIYLSVWDLILASKATEFITCTGCYRQRDFCSRECNWDGSFAKLAMSMRQTLYQKSSQNCWPVNRRGIM